MNTNSVFLKSIPKYDFELERKKLRSRKEFYAKQKKVIDFHFSIFH
jgi:hypothetical protein